MTPSGIELATFPLAALCLNQLRHRRTRKKDKEKVNTRDELATRIMNSAALIKQERRDDLRRATRTVAKRVEKCIEVDDGIFEHLL